MELFDSHCHIQSAGAHAGERATRELWAKAGSIDEDGIIRRAREAAVTRLLCVGCDLDDSRLAVAFVQPRAQCWAAVGIHPHESMRYTDAAAAQAVLAALATQPKVVAIGECGLDYFYDHSPKAAQLHLLEMQIALAQQQDLPLVFHVREAFDDFWPLFERYAARGPIRGVLHSFTDSLANLERALGHGLLVGVNGIATFTKKPEQLAMYRAIPLGSLLLETDAPFLTPHPFRGTICEPYHVRTTATFLAELRNEPVGALAEATTQNARQLFGV